MLERLPQSAREHLVADGLQVDTTQTEVAFARLRVTDGIEVVLVDLVADSAGVLESPMVVRFEHVTISVDTLHEILVNKLCALLGRAEIRDLQDVKAILEAGGELDRALRDAPEKDAGFSGPVLAWLLRQFPLRRLGQAAGLSAVSLSELEVFRDRLVERLVQAAKPEGPA